MKTNLLHKFLFSLTQAGALVLALTCFSTQAQAGIVLPAVGPRPPGEHDGVSCGYLKVYSATQESQWGEGSYYYLHTGYRIYDTSGHVVKWVENHNTSIDEDPQRVELAPGRYMIWAQSDKDGYVNVPVVIKLAQTTTVHLENGRESDNEKINPAKAVTTSSGQVVGWKA